MKEFQGVDIKEVWDYRLSNAVPQIVRKETWIVEVWNKENTPCNPEDPSTFAKPLETYDTGIMVEAGDEHDTSKIKMCYTWLMSVRDKYSRPDIEELKPIVKKINDANAELAMRGIR